MTLRIRLASVLSGQRAKLGPFVSRRAVALLRHGDRVRILDRRRALELHALAVHLELTTRAARAQARARVGEIRRARRERRSTRW